jgi:hypothetical protein
MTTATFWSKVANNDSSFEAKWKQIMVAPYAQFATRIRAWAGANHYSSRLRLIVVPVLEDHAPNAADYARLASWTQAGLPAGITMRRNGSPRVSGLALETHTESATFDLLPDDAVSNDGFTVNGTQWQAIQTRALSQSAAALLWRTEFNGNNPTDRSTEPPSARGILTPFADPGKVSSLIGWITYRPNGL